MARHKREKRGETGTWELRNGADKENKGLDTRYETSLTDHVIKLSLAC